MMNQRRKLASTESPTGSSSLSLSLSLIFLQLLLLLFAYESTQILNLLLHRKKKGTRQDDDGSARDSDTTSHPSS